jgi:cytochrome bd-type quinol oxidase subunit 2
MPGDDAPEGALWNPGFFAGSPVVAFVQGAAIGAMIRGIPIENGQYSVMPRCLVPGNRGAMYHDLRRDELWEGFFTAAPRRLRRSVERYKIVKRA